MAYGPKQNEALINLPPELRELLARCPKYTFATSTAELVELACSADHTGWREVAYEVPGKGRVVEARVCRVRNGVAANYVEPYMRRRDPDCLVIGDSLPTDKKRFVDRFGNEFEALRRQTFEWLKTQELALFAFVAGQKGTGVDALVVAPANAGFFALGLGLLQGILGPEELTPDFAPRAILYVAPPFRHTHFDGKQIVVHHRRPDLHELFSYNLYPGPSAKKGVYGVLINIGEQEGWVTAHCSTVQVVTPYDNTVTIMHEGASGGGKSEMLEHIHREADGRLLLGRNIITGERRHLVLPRACDLHPVTDDMALCHPSLQNHNRKLTLMDAEDAWFVRVNHISAYGTDPHLEALTIRPPQPILFLSIDAVPQATALIWEHIEDAPGVVCPNPRVILPRKIVPGVVDGPVTVDIRSFGVRTPPCTKEKPAYGIIGLFHVLPPALAWLWRLVAPRGHDNPSIVQTEGMTSEGVGSYWPFATGRRVDQANLLLRQFEICTRMRYILCPNQNLGAWQVGFMPQWLAREYLARRGSAHFKPEQLTAARCPLLGYALRTLQIEGSVIPRWFLEVNTQPEVGDEAYDNGAEILKQFFGQQLTKFLEPDLLPLGRQIIDCCLSGGSVRDYAALLPAE
ncbi:MAG: DUF4914 family protein [Bryobacteraceae bacterium]|nr:DUF4914 family protein [Bryobacteraceae bacterium]